MTDAKVEQTSYDPITVRGLTFVNDPVPYGCRRTGAHTYRDAHGNIYGEDSQGKYIRALVAKLSRGGEMTELKVTEERVREAAKECPDTRAVLTKLFPEAFQDEYVGAMAVIAKNRARPYRLHLDHGHAEFLKALLKTQASASVMASQINAAIKGVWGSGG